MNIKRQIIVLILGVVFLFSPALVNSLAKKIYTITNDSVGSVSRAQDLLPSEEFLYLRDKISEARRILSGLTLKTSKDTADYYETRSGFRKRFVDSAEKEIGLALLNKQNSQIETIKVLKRGGELVNIDHKFQITVKERTNGVRWNNFNTQYEIKPDNYILLANKYPVVDFVTLSKRVKNKKGKWVNVKSSYPVVEEVIYTPYTSSLHTADTVGAGKLYIKNKVKEAYEDLEKRKVYSLALSGQLVSYVVPSEFIEKIPMLEQTDLDEFYADPEKNFERVLVIIGANQDLAFKYTGNFAGAIGWVQFTKSTYNSIAKTYNQAGLIKDFNTGGRDHLNSIKAAILLYDYNLAGLIDRFGPQIVNDPKLEEYLAASYNGAPRWVYASITRAADSSVISEWGSHLRKETKGFLTKLRFLSGWFE